MQATFHSWRLVAIATAIFTGMSIVSLLLYVLFVEIVGLSPYSGDRQLQYEYFAFYESQGSVVALTIGPGIHLDVVAPRLYLRVHRNQGVSTVFLPELTEKEVGDLAVQTEPLQSPSGPVGTRYYIGETSYVEFIKGQLVGASIKDDAIEFSTENMGRFLKVPTSKREIERLFGPPVRIQKQLRPHV